MLGAIYSDKAGSVYKLGKGFSMQNLRRMRQFYIMYLICSILMSELNWTYYLELIKEDNKTIFSSEFKLAIPSEKEFIEVTENEKKNSIGGE